MTPDIYTIGYGNRRIEDFIDLLQKFEIELLIDIRSKPYSRFNPNFRSNLLQAHLANHNIQYLFMGKKLGGRPSDTSCYSQGEVDYKKISCKGFFLEGIGTLVQIRKKGIRMALMCAELSPDHCHRKALVGNYLESQNISVLHIDKNGTIQNELFST